MPSTTGLELRHFTTDEIAIPKEDAQRILMFYFGQPVPEPEQLTSSDVGFAQDMVKEFAKKAAKHWFDHASGKDLEYPQIYECIRVQIRANFRSVWAIRMQGGDLTY